MVAAVAGGPRRGTRPHRQCVARDGAPGAKKNAIKPWRRVGWVIPPQGNADFAAAGFSCLPASLRCGLSVVEDETPRQLLSETRNRFRRRRVGRALRVPSGAATCSWRPLGRAAHDQGDGAEPKLTGRTSSTTSPSHPGAKRITLVMDNLRRYAFPVGPLRVRLHAQDGSWLNVAGELSVMIRQCLNRRTGPARRGRGLEASREPGRSTGFTTDDARVPPLSADRTRAERETADRRAVEAENAKLRARLRELERSARESGQPQS